MAKLNLGGKNTMDNFEKQKSAYLNMVKDENSTQEQREAAFTSMFDALQADLTNKITAEARQMTADQHILASRGQNILTTEEKEFFNEIAQSVLDSGFAEEKLLPETTQNRIFEGLREAHPLLDALGLQNLGAVSKFIYSDPTKAYAWKEIFGTITGQGRADFTEQSFTQLKLTSFVVIANDMLELGPEWVERYVRELLIETISTGLEFGFVNGRGQAQLEPVGLMMNVDANTGAVTPKTSSGTLTFAPSQYGEVIVGELFNVISALSVDEAGKPVNVAGNVVMVVNPTDAIAVQFRTTIQTPNGSYVTSLPYNVQLVTSKEVPTGKAIFFVKGRYLAAIAGGTRLRKFDQTLAIEDATLYTIKQIANGQPKDNKAALVYDLDIQFTPAP